MKSHFSTKQLLQKAFLIISAFIVLYGTMPVLFFDGVFRVGGLLLYTVLSNLLVVFAFFIMALLPKWKGHSYLSFTTLVCISVTGVVYNIVLVPFGAGITTLSNWSNFSLHLFSVLLVIINYFIFEDKGRFTYKHIWAGLLPPFMYWAVLVSLGSSPYFFMNPEWIGWPMVLFWFVIIMVFIIGLGLAVVLFDRRRRLHAGGVLLITGILCALMVILFAERPSPLITSFAFSVENVLELDEGGYLPVRSDYSAVGNVHIIEEGISIIFELSIRRSGIYSLDYGANFSEGIITAFLVTDNNSNVIFHHVGEDFGSVANVELSAGNFFVSWSYIASYEDVLAFFVRLELGAIEQEQSDYFMDVFSSNLVNTTAYGSLFLR